MAIMTKREKKALANKLDAIAMGETFYMCAIVEAENIKWLSLDEKACLRRYRNGNQSDTDHITLQDIAIKIRGK
jgi:hypothetical protein